MNLTRQGYRVREFPELQEFDETAILYTVSRPDIRPRDNKITLGWLYRELETRIVQMLGVYFPKRVFTVGNGQDSAFILTHNINTKDLTWSVYDIETGDDVDIRFTRLSTIQVRIEFNGEIPEIDQYRVVLRG